MGDGTLAPDAWRPVRGYLDTATYGLPPVATVEAGHRALDEWADGSGRWTVWNDATDAARRSFAGLVGVHPGSVAIGPAASTLLSLVASSLPDTAEVVVAEEDFTALLFPFLAQTSRGVTVRPVPLTALADTVTDRTTVVAWSAVQSADGRIADSEAVLDAAAAARALTVVDGTQALPWFRPPLERIDAVVCSAYKWLCCPRGTAFMVGSPALLSMCRPSGASWFAAPDVYGAFYGPPLRLADDARRLDLSPAWHAWVGATESLDALARIGIEAIHDHDVRLADAFRQKLGFDATGSAIVSIAGLGSGIEERLAVHGIKAAARADGCRLSFHLYNDDDDVDAACAALERVAR
jgi:selenocysteine lyase/cysteine desulfurase